MRAASLLLVVVAVLAGCAGAEHAPLARVPHVISAALRPDGPNASELIYRFDPGDQVEQFDSAGGHIRVHYTRAGKNAVRALDADHDGTPDDVVVVADTYEEVLANQAALGFRQPVGDSGTPGGDGGDGRFDVYLVDFAGMADGTFVRDRCGANGAGPSVCSGYMVQENDYAGYGYPSFEVATRILSSHELFHAVQAAYDDGQGPNWSEATAVWATEQFDGSLSDFEGFLSGWFDRPDRSIDTEPTGPVDDYSYGLAIFPEFLSEKYGTALVREIWEDSEDGANGVADPRWLDALSARLESGYQTSFGEAWLEFARWVVRSGIGGPAGTTWANAGSYPRVARSEVTAPASLERLRMFRASLRAWTLSPGGRGVMAAELVSPDPSDLEGQDLILAVRKGLDVALATASDGHAELAAASGSEVIVVVASGLTSGGSKRPSLCIGSPDEVASCKATLLAASQPEASEAMPEPMPETDQAESAVVETVADDGPEATAAEAVADGTAAEASADAGPTLAAKSNDCAAGAGAGWGVALALVLLRARRRA